ncbi:Leucine-rich repeat and calponin homology domain-containing protein 2 [Smittium mucronatum]|uniref:Leucine-rich repeat and calponin homology domain-containing protein 2 n=1 Tax=Smittium mucronatum TaxID=133383 RepID=A0A1R0GPL4_9FUNG|nr:Leucine-rich repeat and calponin homology domain-containing protein 2 [Smittium mucronatum]
MFSKKDFRRPLPPRNYVTGRALKGSRFPDNMYVLWENPPFIYNKPDEPIYHTMEYGEGKKRLVKLHRQSKMMFSDNPYEQWFSTRSFNTKKKTNHLGLKKFLLHEFNRNQIGPLKDKFQSFSFYSKDSNSFRNQAALDRLIRPDLLFYLDLINFTPVTSSMTLNLKASAITKFAVVSSQNHFEFLTYLILADNNLSEISNSLFRLSNLEILELQNNFITSKPESLKPKHFNKLKNLRKVNLSNNLLTSIPSDFGLLPNLEKLTISDNRIFFLPIELLSSSLLTFDRCPLSNQVIGGLVADDFKKYLADSPLFRENSYIITKHFIPPLELTKGSAGFLKETNIEDNCRPSVKPKSNLESLDVYNLLNYTQILSNLPKFSSIFPFYTDEYFTGSGNNLTNNNKENSLKVSEMYDDPSKCPLIIHRTHNVPKLSDLAGSIAIRNLLFSKIHKLELCSLGADISNCKCIDSKFINDVDKLRIQLGLKVGKDVDEFSDDIIDSSAIPKDPISRDYSFPDLIKVSKKIDEKDNYTDLNKIELSDLFPFFPSSISNKDTHMGTIWSLLIDDHLDKTKKNYPDSKYCYTYKSGSILSNNLVCDKTIQDAKRSPEIGLPSKSQTSYNLLAQPLAEKWPLWFCDLVTLNRSIGLTSLEKKTRLKVDVYISTFFFSSDKGCG